MLCVYEWGRCVRKPRVVFICTCVSYRIVYRTLTILPLPLPFLLPPNFFFSWAGDHPKPKPNNQTSNINHILFLVTLRNFHYSKKILRFSFLLLFSFLFCCCCHFKVCSLIYLFIYLFDLYCLIMNHMFFSFLLLLFG